MKKKFIKRNLDHWGTISYLINRKGIENIYKTYELNNIPNLNVDNNSKNLVIGFGITSKNISSFKSSDGCVIGSEICKKISKSIENRQNPVTNVTNMVKSLRKKLS